MVPHKTALALMGTMGNQMAILNNQSFMGMRNYSMPPALSGYDLTPAQRHARDTEPVLSVGYNKNGDIVPVNHHSRTGVPDDILRFLRRTDNTDDTGGYTDEQMAALTTHGETLDNRYSSIMTNQDYARNAMGDAVEYKGLDLSDSKSHSDGGILTKLLSGLTYNALGYITGTSAEDVRKYGISLRVDGDEFFATDGENTVPVTKETAAAIEAANNGGDAQEPSQQSGSMGMSFNAGLAQPPALTTQNENGTGNTVVTKDNTGPVLRQPTSNTASTGNAARRMTGGYTGNARGSALPNMQIGLGERLMRMGMAGLSKGGQGSLAQLGAMYGASADVNQANRQASMDTFKIEEERRQAHANRVAALAASKNKGAGGGGDLSKVKDFQGKSFGFYNRGVDAERVLSQLDGQGAEFWKTVGSKIPVFGNAIVGPEYRQYDQARRNFVNAVLRRESGAVISDAEFENANQQYFPQFGDGEAEIAQKRENRRTTMLGIRISAGDTMQYTSDYPTSGLVTQIGNMKITEAPAKTAK